MSSRKRCADNYNRTPAVEAGGGRLRAKNGFLVLKCKGNHVINPTPE